MAKKTTNPPAEKETEKKPAEEVVEAEEVQETETQPKETDMDDEEVEGELLPAEEAKHVLDSAIEIAGKNTEMIRPLASVEGAIQVWTDIVDFIQNAFVYGLDWGVVNGIDKPMLFKSGAERVKTWFGFVPTFPIDYRTMVLDWTGKEHDGEPFFFYEYLCRINWGGHVVGEAIGSCNSWETKYRYRGGHLTCPNCGATEIRKSKYPPRSDPNAPPGWYCWANKGGCGAEFAHDDPAITEQQVGKIKNPDPADVANTVNKMAQKRAFVSAVIMAAGIGGIFSPDAEDFYGIKILDATTKVPITQQKSATSPNTPQPQKQTQSAPQGGAQTQPPARTGRNTSKTPDTLQWIMDELKVDTGQAVAIANEINAANLQGETAVREAAKKWMIEQSQ